MRLAAALLALAACAAPGPASTPFAVLGFAPQRLDLAAAGRTVAVGAPEGLCLTRRGVSLSPEAAVVMLEGCDGGDGLLRSVLVGDGPLAEPGERDAALDAIAAALREPEGWRAVGLGGAALEVLAVRRAPDALFVVVQDRGRLASPLGRRCRAFTEIGERLTIVTVAAPPGGEAAPEALMAEAGAMVAALRRANPPARGRTPVFGTPPAPRPAI